MYILSLSLLYLFSANSVRYHLGILTIGIRTTASSIPDIHGSRNMSVERCKDKLTLEEHSKALA